MTLLTNLTMIVVLEKYLVMTIHRDDEMIHHFGGLIYTLPVKLILNFLYLLKYW